MLIYNTKVITLRQHFFKKFFQIIFFVFLYKKAAKKARNMRIRYDTGSFEVSCCSYFFCFFRSDTVLIHFNIYDLADLFQVFRHLFNECYLSVQ